MQKVRLLAALCFLLLGFAALAAAQAGMRIVFKDGTWQQVMQYEVAGDRTRFLSTARREWEEVPSDLVDWKATEEWNARPWQMPPEEAEAPGSESQPPDKLAVAPGLDLPASGGVFILDMFSGQPSLVELIQVPGALNHNTGSIFHAGIRAGASFQQSLELKRSHARTQAHVSLPQLFVKITEADPAQHIVSADRFRIVRLESKKDSRILAAVSVNIAGRQSASEQFVPARIEDFGEGWLKVTPMGELQPGEYALVEMLNQERFNSYAWDFGYDPHAPANLNSQNADWAPPDERNTIAPVLKPRGQ